MKKIYSLLLVIVMLLSLCACGGGNDNGSGKKTETLTLDNVNSYLDVNPKVESCTTNKGELIQKYAMSRGDAEILIETQNDSGAKFKKATITCEVTITGSGNYGWEFVNENIPSENRGTSKVDCNNNSKKIKIDLPYDGEESVSEKLKLALYTDENHVMASDLTDRQITVKIVDVVGTVEIEE